MLEMKNVSKLYMNTQAVNDVSLKVSQGECLGLVGESGSGKSTVAKLLLGLEKCDAGEILLNGLLLNRLKGKQLKAYRRHVQIVFQDPSASLNPKLPIWKSIIEPLENYPEVTPSFLIEYKKDKQQMAEALLSIVGLPSDLLKRFPHQLSGGQKQRVAIARGISLQPALLICDEPTSSLDVSVQAQILNLLKELNRDLGMSFLFISHDLAAIRYICNRIILLKEGEIVDLFSSEDLFSDKRHPYTKLLLEAGMDV